MSQATTQWGHPQPRSGDGAAKRAMTKQPGKQE
jgi:hypothetical protein